jgi:hypothetical protein
MILRYNLIRPAGTFPKGKTNFALSWERVGAAGVRVLPAGSAVVIFHHRNLIRPERLPPALACHGLPKGKTNFALSLERVGAAGVRVLPAGSAVVIFHHRNLIRPGLPRVPQIEGYSTSSSLTARGTRLKSERNEKPRLRTIITSGKTVSKKRAAVPGCGPGTSPET